MKGFSYPGKSPLKQGIEHIDPLDLGLIDEAKKVKVKKPSTTVKTTTLPGGHHHRVTKGPGAKVPPQSALKPYQFKTSTKQIPKVKDVTGKKLTNIILKGDKLPADKIAKKHAEDAAIKAAKKKAAIKTAKRKATMKSAKKLGGKVLGRAVPYAGWALLATDIYGVGKKMKEGKGFGQAIKSHYLGTE